jgi:hypothetical protein
MEKSNAKTGASHSPSEVIGNVVTVRGKLALLGWPSMRAWASAHGYERMTVSATVKTWGLRTDRTPHGGLARAVMRDLRETFATGKQPPDATLRAQ